MMRLAVYHPDTGEIRSIMEFSPSSVDDALLNVPEGLLAVEVADGVTPATHYIDADDQPQAYPPRPGEWAVWTGTEWTDQRTEADREGERQAHRAATYLTKSEFLQACMATGLLTPSEAAVAAKGDIPAPFLPAVASMTPEQQDMLPVIWPAVTRINRMDPLILAIAKGARISEETLDALFGLTPTL